MLRLPERLREAFKSPFGPVYTDAEDLLRDAGDAPLVTVGDVVTAHLLEAGRRPDLAVVDGRTERETVSPSVAETLARLPDGTRIENPPAELSADLLAAVAAGLDDGPRVVDVDGEEDLATLPAVLVAPVGSSVVYGQPGEGMVLVRVTPETKREMRELLSAFDGDVDAAFSLLGVDD